MQIYHYAPGTHQYIGSGVADADPMQAGKYLIPANATTIECTLNDKDGFTKNFNETTSTWEYREIPAPIPRTWYQNRITEYPKIGDQLDALFHAGVFPAEMAAAIQAVKDKYPKD